MSETRYEMDLLARCTLDAGGYTYFYHLTEYPGIEYIVHKEAKQDQKTFIRRGYAEYKTMRKAIEAEEKQLGELL